MGRKSRGKTPSKKTKKKQPGSTQGAESGKEKKQDSRSFILLLRGLMEKIRNYRPPRTLLDNSDIIAAVLYYLVMFIIILPSIKRGIDVEHHTTLLINSLHVRDGWVPFRDFYPWYGPLYYYLLGPIIWLGGGDILSVKLFLKVFSPIISMTMFIVALRAFRIPWQGRLFAVLASAYWGVERLFHCGSTRTMIGLLLIAFWVWLIRVPKTKLLRLAVFPSVLIGVFYSPEVGIYLVPSALAVAFLDLASSESSERIRALLYYAVGAAAAVIILLLFYFGTTFAKNYIDFISYSSSNTHWAYGRPLLGLDKIRVESRVVLYYLPPIILLAAGIQVFVQAMKKGLSTVPPWIPACILFGTMLYSTVYLRASDDHLLFALPPFLALMGMIFANRYRFWWPQILMIAVFLWGHAFFPNSFFNRSYWIMKFNPQLKWADTELFLGVYDRADRVKMVNEIEKFCDEHPNETVLFPLHGFEAYRVGQPFLWAFDDLFWVNISWRKQQVFEQFNKINPDYICLDMKYRNWVYMHEDTDAIFDHIVSHYQPIKGIGSNIIYRRAPNPMVPASLAKTLPGPFVLDKTNEFSIEWNVPPGIGQGYLEMDEKFIFSSELLRRFTMPFAMAFVDGEVQNWRKLGHGRTRIRTSPEGGTYRFYFPENTRKVGLVITFWGILNAKPEKVELTNVEFYKFNFKPIIPYTERFLKEGY